MREGLVPARPSAVRALDRGASRTSGRIVVAATPSPQNLPGDRGSLPFHHPQRDRLLKAVRGAGGDPISATALLVDQSSQADRHAWSWRSRATHPSRTKPKPSPLNSPERSRANLQGGLPSRTEAGRPMRSLSASRTVRHPRRRVQPPMWSGRALKSCQALQASQPSSTRPKCLRAPFVLPSLPVVLLIGAGGEGVWASASVLRRGGNSRQGPNHQLSTMSRGRLCRHRGCRTRRGACHP